METNSTSFFPLQQDDELAITCPEFSIWDVGIDHISYPADSPKVEAGINLDDNEKGKLPEKLQELKGGSANQELQKKILHREIERHRRREMATLYASLRSVLPPQHIKVTIKRIFLLDFNMFFDNKNVILYCMIFLFQSYFTHIHVQ